MGFEQDGGRSHVDRNQEHLRRATRTLILSQNGEYQEKG